MSLLTDIQATVVFNQAIIDFGNITEGKDGHDEYHDLVNKGLQRINSLLLQIVVVAQGGVPQLNTALLFNYNPATLQLDIAKAGNGYLAGEAQVWAHGANQDPAWQAASGGGTGPVVTPLGYTIEWLGEQGIITGPNSANDWRVKVTGGTAPFTLIRTQLDKPAGSSADIQVNVKDVSEWPDERSIPVYIYNVATGNAANDGTYKAYFTLRDGAGAELLFTLSLTATNHG